MNKKLMLLAINALVNYEVDEEEQKMLEQIQTLQARDIEVNSWDWEGTKLLFDAVEKGFVQATKALIKKRADVNTADEFGETPLHDAASRDHTEAIKVLVKLGANINKR